MPSEQAVQTVKKLRQNIDAQISAVEHLMGINSATLMGSVENEIRSAGARELALVRTKLQESKMWAGKILEVLGNPFPPELADKAEVQ